MIESYRKKPVTIRACQWTGHNPEEVLAFVGENAYLVGKEMNISTPEGPLHASVGDFIIRGVKGEYYPCKPDIFRETYEAPPPADTKL